jgi:hypothetical protein
MSKQTDLINIPDAITVSGSNVGIGTSSPDAKLHLYNATNGNTLKVEADGNYNARIRIQAGSSNDSFLEFADPDDSDVGEIVYSHSSNSMRFNTNASERMRIDSTGNVGIGTSSPNNYSANHKSITLNAPTTPLIDLEVNGTRTGSFVGTSTNVDINAVANVPLRFLTNDTERMRIDSSGNLLVGKTSTGGNVEGHQFNSNGAAYITRDGASVLHVNRKTSDGEIISIRKNDVAVGSIGVQSTDQLYIATPDGSGVGLIFDGDNRKIDPTDGAGSNLDNAVDLGTGAYRFKDLYLSGGVYLGGTGSANKLDDYEEGTCTITIKDSSNNSATMGINVFRYVKIGSLVHLTGTLQWSSTSALNTSRIQIHGLPFTSASSASGGTNRSPVSNGTSTSGSFTIPREEIAFGIDPNATFIWGSRATGNNYDDILTKSHLGTSGVLYSLQAIYETDA